MITKRTKPTGRDEADDAATLREQMGETEPSWQAQRDAAQIPQESKKWARKTQPSDTPKPRGGRS